MTNDGSLEVQMRLVTYREKGSTDAAPRAGALVDEQVVDLQAADPSLPAGVLGLIQGGPAVLERARAAGANGLGRSLADVQLLAPISRPPKIVCIGVNYADHAAEAGRALPRWPSVFLKAASCIVGPGDPVVRPPTTEQLDYEIELAVVIGKQAKSVLRNEALGYVAGYTIMNDVSARDLQLGKDGGIILGKNFDSSAPFGPCLTLSDEISDPSHLRLRTWVNGELRQDGNTHTLIFDIPAIIVFLTQQMTLEPGDIIATGTPAGVGLGMKPQVWLQPGDAIRMEIEGIGVLENSVI
jgi:2-keto-4-pentenoate hydratase/2-oxohepta-3-ene-1,7-dioic acid hydratase in catechol pathway